MKFSLLTPRDPGGGRVANMNIQWIKDWFFKDYEREKLDIDRKVVARFSRGNIRVQDGHYINEKQLSKLSRGADKAMARLKLLAD